MNNILLMVCESDPNKQTTLATFSPLLIPVMKSHQSFFKLYHIRPFITGTFVTMYSI